MYVQEPKSKYGIYAQPLAKWKLHPRYDRQRNEEYQKVGGHVESHNGVQPFGAMANSCDGRIPDGFQRNALSENNSNSKEAVDDNDAHHDTACPVGKLKSKYSDVEEDGAFTEG